MVITRRVLTDLKDLVEKKKAELDTSQDRYDLLREPNCTTCPGSPAYLEARPDLLAAHEAYRKALEMYLNAMQALKTSSEISKKEAEAEAVEGGATEAGPEFAPGRKTLRPHCEQWTTMNKSWGLPSRSMCAIICRNQPTCVGFARDLKYEWCLWFDDVKPQSEKTCSATTETEFFEEAARSEKRRGLGRYREVPRL